MAVIPAAAAGGGLVVPNATSYVVAPFEVQARVVGDETLVAPLAGVTATGAVGGAICVVNDQSGPAVLPFEFHAVICQ